MRPATSPPALNTQLSPCAPLQHAALHPPERPPLTSMLSTMSVTVSLKSSTELSRHSSAMSIALQGHQRDEEVRCRGASHMHACTQPPLTTPLRADYGIHRCPVSPTHSGSTEQAAAGCSLGAHFRINSSCSSAKLVSAPVRLPATSSFLSIAAASSLNALRSLSICQQERQWEGACCQFPRVVHATAPVQSPNHFPQPPCSRTAQKPLKRRLQPRPGPTCALAC
jgi:hypothetical protein